MTRLTLRRGKLSRSSGQWQDEDHDVLADGKMVGRIYEQRLSFGGRRSYAGCVAHHRNRASDAGRYEEHGRDA
jgi:hypothetical protein